MTETLAPNSSAANEEGKKPEGRAWREKPYLKYYNSWTPAEIELSGDTLVDMFIKASNEHGKDVMLDFFGGTTTYAQAHVQVRKVAAGLKALGVRPGDRVAICLPNCPQHLISIFAVLYLGATVVEHNPLYTARELQGPFIDHGAKVIIAWDKIAPLCEELVNRTQLHTVVTVNMIEAMPKIKQLALKLPISSLKEKREQLHSPAPGTVPFQKLVDGTIGGDGAYLSPVPERSLDDEAFILFTSGTTGKPKGAMLTHRNIMANVAQGLAWVGELGEGEQEIYLAALPMFHIFGLTLTAALGVATGGKLCLLPKPEIPLIVDQMKKQVPTYMPGVPTLYDKILEAAEEHNLDINGVKNALSGAAPLPVSISHQWQGRTGGSIIEGYGLTETSPIATANPISEHARAGYIGIPFPSTEVRVADPEDLSRTMPDGEAGELLIRGPQVFSGYINFADDEQPFFEDWFKTGDMAVMEEDGFLRIVSRIKEMIITGGFNVYPAEVEEVLADHPMIAKAGVVGLAKEDGSDEVVAAVVLDEHVKKEDFEEEKVKEWARHEMTRYKVPRRFFVVDELPTDLIGKIRRREIKDMVEKIVAEEG